MSVAIRRPQWRQANAGSWRLRMTMSASSVLLNNGVATPIEPKRDYELRLTASTLAIGDLKRTTARLATP